MQFKVDENLPSEVASMLRQAGHDATTVVQQHLAGSTDPQLAAVCQKEDRALVTLDMDFANIRAYPPPQYAGLIVLRLSRQDKPYVLSVFTKIVPLLMVEPVRQRLWIVEEHRIRIRD
jgi:predicted nuclease of predicted toxin-antitoxin system